MEKITFVGCGCGPGLITVSGLEAVKHADAVVYDDLVDTSVLAFAKDDCKLFSVGKRNGSHSAKQEEINEILVDCAGKFENTVRLKGGDSFVFGRGGEEALALDEKGVSYRFIPGVSSSVAAAESAGIPVTHRGLAQSFTVVTGHTATELEENYSALAKLDGTLIFLMGLARLGEIAQKLIENGKSPETPCSVVSNGCNPEQKRFDGTLETISEKAKDAVTPAIIVVGEVCRFRFESKIERKSVLVTGTESFCNRLGKELKANDFEVYSAPLIEIVPVDGFLPIDFSRKYDMLVFTSANGVEVFFDELKRQRFDLRLLSGLKFAVIGSGTAKALENHGIFADFVPTEFTAEALGNQLAESEFKSCRMLILRSKNGSPLLVSALERAGVNFTDVKTYKTKNVPFNRDVPKTDCIVFASAGGAEAYFETFELKAKKIICIGKVTAERLKSYTETTPVVCPEHSICGIIDSILTI